MTKLLAEINEIDDIAAIRDICADIWTVPYALLPHINNDFLTDRKDFELLIELSAKQLAGAAERELFKKADGLCVLLSFEHIIEDLQLIQNYAQRDKLIACLDFHQAADLSLIPHIKTFGFKGVWLKPKAVHTHFLKEVDIATIGRLIAVMHQHHLAVGLSGGLEAPDIPRLLPFAPNWLGFSVKTFRKASTALDHEKINLIRALIPHEDKQDKTQETYELGTDRLLVRDFILPMEIGAYSHEVGRKQRVCFNITADIARLSVNPEDMSHIFSYDLIIDGIRRLVGLGHVELVETLAERVAAFILSYPRVQRVIVRVEKLDLGPGAVGIEIEREKKNTFLR